MVNNWGKGLGRKKQLMQGGTTWAMEGRTLGDSGQDKKVSCRE